MPIKLNPLLHKIVINSSLFLLLFILMDSALAQQPRLKADAPQSYQVQYGDSLWKLANIFLEDPWLWPQLWRNNPEIADPNLIYPGDVLEVFPANKQQELRVKPRLKIISLQPSLPYLSYAEIKNHLNQSRVMARNGLDDGLYIMEIGQTNEPRTLAAKGDFITAVGDINPEVSDYAIFRHTEELRDPVNKRMLGNLVVSLGHAQVRALSGRIAELEITASTSEIREGDMLLPFVEDSFSEGLQLYLTQELLEGQILRSLNTSDHLALYQPVIINLGEKQIQPGLLLEVLQPGRRYRNPATGEAIFANNKRKGLVMVFQTFEKTSLALILESKSNLSAGDILRPARPTQKK